MRTYTAAQIQRAEQPLLDAGIPLMARAAAGLAVEAGILLLTRRPTLVGASIVALVGSGNNGGDALFAAGLLAGSGANVIIVRSGSRMHSAGLAAALRAGATVLETAAALPPGGLSVRDVVSTSDLIIDGVTGISTTADPALRGRARDVVVEVIAALETRAARAGGEPFDARPLIIAVDQPSGVGTDTGSVPDASAVLRADLTVTFSAMKPALVTQPAAAFAGRVIVVDIGLAPHLSVR